MQTEYGEIVRELPEGFIPKEQWPEYNLAAVPPPLFKPEAVGKAPRGVRWGFWPLQFEEYISDNEPDLSLSDPNGTARNRIVMWQRITRTDKPNGWHHFLGGSSKLEGFAEIKNQEYWKKWSESARRHRTKWLEEFANKKYVIEKVSHRAFADAYKESTVVKKAGRTMLDIAERIGESENSEYFGVRRVSDGMLMAGMNFNHSPSSGASYYLCGFYRPEASNEPLMIALVDHWHATSHMRGIHFLHMGGFWQKGKPSNWKGFSQFKAKFGLFYVMYPPVLFKFVRGKLF